MSRTIEEFQFFIKERQIIKDKKDAGEERPWTNDVILDLTKFTNIDRNDDFGSRELYEFIKDKDLYSKIFYSVFYRTAYSVRAFFPAMSGDYKKDIDLFKNGGLDNFGKRTYQVFLAKNTTMDNFLVTTAVDVVNRIYNNWDNLKGSSILETGNIIADYYKETSHKRLFFIGTEIAKDLSFLFPDIIDPNSMCLFNIGAKKGLKLLLTDTKMNEEEKVKYLLELTKFTPSILEHSLCEFMKWDFRYGYMEEHGKVSSRWLYKQKNIKTEEW